MEKEELDMENIINEIFKERVVKMKEKLKFNAPIFEETEELNEKEIQFRTAVNNIPTALKQTRRNIVDSFINYIEILDKKNQNYYEEYYKQGVIDGIKLMNGVLK